MFFFILQFVFFVALDMIHTVDACTYVCSYTGERPTWYIPCTVVPTVSLSVVLGALALLEQQCCCSYNSYHDEHVRPTDRTQVRGEIYILRYTTMLSSGMKPRFVVLTLLFYSPHLDLVIVDLYLCRPW